jgi:hypothetical protein
MDELSRGVFSVLATGLVTLIFAFGCSAGSSSGGGPSGNTNHDPLRTRLSDPPYLVGEDGLDVTTAVEDGKPPYSCTIYGGPGEGTVPAGVSVDPGDPTGCTLLGDATGEELPGGYGFMVVVEDEAGDSVEIPIHYAGRPCATAGVTLSPAESPPRVVDATPVYQWDLQVTDIDFPCEDAECSTCRFCLSMQFLALDPLSGAAELLCANEGDVCSDCGEGCLPPSPLFCPSTGEMSRVLEVRDHAPIRQGPAWVTMELQLDYTGDDLEGCGAKQWTCHMETLELQR